MIEQENLTIPDLQTYIESLARLYAMDEPYTIDLTTGRVSTATTSWNIIIPSKIISEIKMEEL